MLNRTVFKIHPKAPFIISERLLHIDFWIESDEQSNKSFAVITLRHDRIGERCNHEFPAVNPSSDGACTYATPPLTVRRVKGNTLIKCGQLTSDVVSSGVVPQSMLFRNHVITDQ